MSPTIDPLRTSSAGLKQWVRRRASLVGSVTGTTSPSLVLTFDDGPDPVETPLVLDALRENDATATFFVLLTRSLRYPELLREVQAAGHEIALHGPDHRDLTSFSHGEAVTRTRRARSDLEDIVGERVRWFRPPYGSQSPSTWVAARRAGLMPVLWSGTTWDWKDVSPEARMDKALEGARAGGVLLAHDGFAGPEDGVDDGPAPLEHRAALIAQLLPLLTDRGLRAVSLRQALTEARPVRTAQFSRKS
jgi:peptidoglycan/xylan/chitin deacetylase (PgdA/CDA1 family)